MQNIVDNTKLFFSVFAAVFFMQFTVGTVYGIEEKADALEINISQD